MKVVILAGGYGTRLSEETTVVPKPLVEIGGYPILWHIMKIYSHYGLNDFVICCGHKGSLIKDYFRNFFHRNCDFTIDLADNTLVTHHSPREPWRVTVVDTGEKTMTGGRLKRVREHLGEQTFCLTYGDGVADVNIRDLIAFHHQQGALATVTAVQLPGRWGALKSLLRPTASRRLSGEGQRRRPHDQRRVLRRRARGPRPDRRRGDGLGAGTHAPARRQRSTRGLPARGILAEHGHLARQGSAPGDLGFGATALARLAAPHARHDRIDARPVSPSVADLRRREPEFGLASPERYLAFAGRVHETKCRLLELLIAAKRSGKRVVDYGAPAKGNTLLIR